MTASASAQSKLPCPVCPLPSWTVPRRPSADSSTAEASTSSTPTAAAADGASNGDAAHPAAAAGGTAPAAAGASKPGGSKGRFKDPLVWIDLEMTGGGGGRGAGVVEGPSHSREMRCSAWAWVAGKQSMMFARAGT